jgi:hypothetical protein
MKEILHEGSRLMGGPRWSSGENRSPLESAYFWKGNRSEGVKNTF